MRYASQMTEAGAISIPTGLDYAGVRAHAKALRLEISPEAWRGLQLCEQEYLSICHKARK